MKKKRIGVLAASLALTGAMASPYNVFADANANNFGIVYANGKPLQKDVNVKIDPERLNRLDTIIGHVSEFVDGEIKGTWKDGYYKSKEYNVCRQYKYLEVPKSGIPSGNGHSFTIKSGEYTLKVGIERVNTEGFADGMKTTVGIIPSETAAGAPKGFSALYGGGVPYTDSNCTTLDTDYTGLSQSADNGKIFVETHMKLYKNNKAFSSNELYLGIIDIDAAQSYMINDKSNQFDITRLFAKSEDALQPTSEESANDKNYYVEQTPGFPSYIYSSGNFNVPSSTKESTKVFAQIGENAQKSEEGLDFVFGFAHKAGSEIEFYVRNYEVTYEAENGGQVAGTPKETIIAGNKPAGAVQAIPNEGYVFDGWTTDKDVQVVINGKTTTIKAGDVIKLDEIKTIIVNDDYNFVAHFSPKSDQSKSYVVEYVADEGGSIDGTPREDVDEGKNPSGSSAKADEGYEFDGWTTNQDVTLDDDTIIKAGDVITDEQIKHVVVDKNMKFTAHFKKKAGSPDTGAFSGDIGAVTIATASTLGLLLVAVAIKVLPQITRRRVKFN